MVVKGWKGTEKTMRCLAFSWKCQVWEHWLVRSGPYSTRWEVSPSRLLSSGANTNFGDGIWINDLEGLVPLETKRIPHAASREDCGISCRPRWSRWRLKAWILNDIFTDLAPSSHAEISQNWGSISQKCFAMGTARCTRGLLLLRSQWCTVEGLFENVLHLIRYQ